MFKILLWQFQEVGLDRTQLEVLASLPALRARFGTIIYATVARLRSNFQPRLNEHEVASIFWQPLSTFLLEEFHGSFEVNEKYSMHSYQFPSHHVFGFTALLCALVAVAVLDRRPSFDMSPSMSHTRMSSLTPSDISREVFASASAPQRSKM